MTATSAIWLAPAKLNLFLHITGRRDDGYHELQTVFQLLDFADELTISDDRSGALSLHLQSDSPITSMPMDHNLILRAAEALRSHVDQPNLGARIDIRKRIPAGAGLGGGSSDAASTLLALNQLWKLQLPSAELASLGLALGADVPVFLQGRSAWAEGIGEHLQPIELPFRHFLVVTPACEVSTSEIFQHEELTRNTSAIKIADFLGGRARNDCESITRKLYSEVDEALNWLNQHAPARMTGTGSSIFASFEDLASAQTVLEKLPKGMRGFVAAGLNSLEHRSSAT